MKLLHLPYPLYGLIIFIQLTVAFSVNRVQAQYYLREEWKSITGAPDSVKISSSVLNLDGDIIVTGNTYDSLEKSNVLITCYSSLGLMKWSTTWNSDDDLSDYGTDIGIDALGNLYVVAASYENTTNFYEIVLLKYDPSGQLVWQSAYANPFGDCFPVKVGLDNSRNIYITGTNESLDYDMLLVKFDSIGTFEWATTYNNGGKELSGNLSIQDPPPYHVNTKITVFGVSEDSTGFWSYVTVVYDAGGNQKSFFKTSAAGAGIDSPKGLIKQANSYYYMCGTHFNGADLDAKLIKLDSNLMLVWADSSNLAMDDGANVLADDQTGDIYVGGWKQTASSRDIVLTKYTSGGSVVWTRSLASPFDKPIAEVTAIQTIGTKILLTGFRRNIDVSEILTIQYDASGDLDWITAMPQHETSISYPTQVLVNASGIYVTGNTTSAGVIQWITVKYNVLEKDTSLIYKDGNPVCYKNELIVRFKSDILKLDEINNVNLYTEFGNISDYVNATNSELIESKLCGIGGSSFLNSIGCDNYKLLRIFKDLKTSDSIAISRLGDKVKVPDFWATFILTIPDGIDIEEVMDSLNTLFPVIAYYHPNPLIELLGQPNDIDYFDQLSLHQGTANGIDMEGAWDIEPGGKPSVHVGVFDTGLDWLHPDFGYDGSNRNTSKVAGGWDFKYGVSLKTLDTGERDLYGWHGTGVSGIIGAVRDNNIGIAGIAGGDADSGTLGASMFSLAITGDTGFYANPFNYVADGLVTSALADSINTNYKFGLHIQNHSWRISNYSEIVHFLTDSNITLLTEAIKFVNTMNVTVVAARGNEDNSEPTYPAVLDDNWILCVGGTGVNGDYKDFEGPGDFAANRGKEIDVAAPASLSLVYTTSGFGGYVDKKGTSYAAPHVTGVGALLMSYLNDSVPSPNNLSPEDVEAILQMSATDVDNPGVDTFTGYGRLNAEGALRLVEKPANALMHYGTKTSSHLETLTRTDSFVTIYLRERFENHNGDWFKEGDYYVDIYEIRTEIIHTLDPNDSIVGFWSRSSSSNLFPYIENDRLIPHHRVNLDSANSTKAWLKGFVYKVYDTLGNHLGWWPADTSVNHYKFAYSILTHDTSYVPPTALNEIDSESVICKLYPNPTGGNQWLSIQSKNSGEIVLIIYDVQGKELNKSSRICDANENLILPLEMNLFPNGIYFVQVMIGDKRAILKSVKYK